MKKIGILLIALVCFARQEDLNSINKKINSTKQNFIKYSASRNKIKHSLEELADKIYAQRNILKQYSISQAKLEMQIRDLSRQVHYKETQMVELEKRKTVLLKEKNLVEVELIDLMVSNLTTSIVAEKEEELSVSAIIKKEALVKIKEKYARRISTIKNDYVKIDRELSEVNEKINAITELITELTLKKQEIRRIRKREHEELASLSHRQTSYKQELAQIIKVQERERELLRELDITLRQAKNTSSTRIKKYGSSYLSVGKKHYNGKKYKPPIDDSLAFKVIKKFGPYVDPIYNIKIHNDYIAIETEQKNPTIRSIMGGKVVFADNLQTLGNVVIVKHSDSMHTIYRNLNRISSNVRVNKDVQAREALGIVQNELVFEVTKDGVPIDPLEIINVPRGSI